MTGKDQKTKKDTRKVFPDLFVVIDIVLYLWLAYRFFQLWAMPSETEINAIVTMSTLMIFEFIMVHSGVFMAVMPFKWSLLFFFPFYGLFALVFNLMTPDNTIMYLYLVVVFNRMRFAFFNNNKELQMQAVLTSVYAVVIYFFSMIIIALSAEAIPEFGLTPEFLERAKYAPKGSGLFIDMPQTAMCLGVIYYILLALYSFGLLRSDLKKWFKSVPL